MVGQAMSRPPLKWHQKVAQGNKARGLREGYRSGLEERNGKFLEDHGTLVLFETFRIPYVIPQSLHHYTPDFLLPNGIIVETKGVWEAQDRAKHLFVKTQFPDLDIRIVFSRGASPINPGSATSCAEWATKHGFKWAEKLIPEAWLTEPGPERHPAEVIAAGPLHYEEFWNVTTRRKGKAA